MATESKKGPDSKRKATESPEADKPLPRMRRRASLPDLHDVGDTRKSYSLPELMKHGLMNPDILKDIVPTIMSQLRPSIEDAIRHTMETTLADTISSAIEKSMTKYKEDVVQPLLNKKDTEIKALESELKKSSKKVRSLESTVGKLTQGLNDLEQYGRCQNLRLNNVPLPDVSKCEETVLDILNKALPFDVVPLRPSDIDRCHRIGKVNKKSNRQVIIKFASYKAKAKAYGSRFNLSNVYMTEDFTQSNQKFVNQLIYLKKAKRIKKFLSIDGKVFAKVVDDQDRFRITSKNDITEMFEDALQEGFIDEDDVNAALQPPAPSTAPDPIADPEAEETVSLF